MTSFKTILLKAPEYYLILLVLIVGQSNTFFIHPIALLLAGGLILQIIYKKRISGLIIASSFAVINIYMLLALISEFNEFPAFTDKARNLLLIGLPLFSLNMAIASMLFYTYSIQDRCIKNTVEVH